MRCELCSQRTLSTSGLSNTWSGPAGLEHGGLIGSVKRKFRIPVRIPGYPGPVPDPRLPGPGAGPAAGPGAGYPAAGPAIFRIFFPEIF